MNHEDAAISLAPPRPLSAGAARPAASMTAGAVVEPADVEAVRVQTTGHRIRPDLVEQTSSPAGFAVRGRIPALDGLRGVAILTVMVYHQTTVMFNSGLYSQGRIGRFIDFWLHGGWAGVDLFFVLSGFLITGILYDAKGSTGYFRNFYARRILRIFPLYYVFLVVSLVILPQFHPTVTAGIAADQIWYWAYLSNVAVGLRSAVNSYVDISWSLAIEEQFYLLWPLLVAVLGRRQLMLACGLLIGVSIVWRTALLAAGASGLTVYVLTPGRLDGLAVGAFIAVALRDAGGAERLRRWARPVAAGSALLVVALAAWSGGLDAIWNDGFGVRRSALQILGFTAIAVLGGSLLVLAIDSASAGLYVRLLESRLLTSFGRYSYALYLFHWPIAIFAAENLFRPDQSLGSLGFTGPGQVVFRVLTTVIPFAAAWLSWHLYEKHFLALKRHFA